MHGFLKANVKGILLGLGVSVVLMALGQVMPLPESAQRAVLTLDYVLFPIIYLTAFCWLCCLIEFGIGNLLNRRARKTR
ncbi:MAG: hypothetical protein OXL38_22945 [Gammaproteobacteria bacterium]|nr:hypothetical protein [Gammaproteobacteria bacterium]MDE0444950.1 hypothetical protein [Gammaproteobacteria bacterium]